ncbi:putative Eukaryotic translation initiation factor 3 subunit A [Cocos nucifera]|uniref:Putative Eukaryotic translation initiation factor 3 subunit A n=1 Tax=Cocos nucifera TaxID=13894 RepID=A0A8K0IRR4_COCNU|nr:putative Eukaryotic translation initiation factor 3 subunit A [Cocos nucifera]
MKPELINVGQKQAALQALHDLITSKRYRAWQKTLERIMFKYVELCVDMRRGRFAKDGLIQYRIICQQVNVSSLEEVIKHFMQLSTERAEQARSQAQALEDALDVEDLEADKRPEDLMLSYVSGEKGKDRSDRELVTPWFKFLWETYRTVLEILRNNSKLEALYASYNKNLSQKDLQLIASSVLLAALSVVPYDRKYGASHLELENEKERNLQMASLINFTLDPKRESRETLSRASLLVELVTKGVMTCVSQEVKDLYHLLEHEFLPLDLASKVQPLLTKISKLGGKLLSASSVPEVQLAQYIPALEKLTTLRALQQVSQVYQSMKIEMLSKMIPFFDFSLVEKISVDAVKHNFVAMNVDHLKDAVLFGNVDIESDRLCDHLTILADSLNRARSLIYPSVKKQFKLGENLHGLSEIADKEHKRLLARKSIIEKRKEEHERHMLEMERVEEYRRLQLQKQTEQAEQQRLAIEYSRRQEQRIRREMEERESQVVQDLLQGTGNLGKRKGKGKITKERALNLVVDEQVKARQEMEKKLQKLAKTMDYMERAKREEEAPLIEQAYQQHLVEEKILHEREQLKEIELSRQHHAGDLQEKNRLSRMLDNKAIFQDRIVSRREAEYSRLKKEREDRINQLAAMRKREREIKRKLLFYIKSEEERLTKLQEEEEARKREEEERRKKEEAERKAKLDAIAERQRQRERELEEKERARSVIYPSVKKQLKLGENLHGLSEIADKEHKRLLARKSIIEKRKEEHERHMLEMERVEEYRRLQLQKQTEQAEQQRLAIEYSRRQEQRIRREMEERESQVVQDLLQGTGNLGKRKGKGKITKERALNLVVDEQVKARQEMEKKLQKLAKTMDYMERAKREEEAPLIEQAYQQHLVEEKILHEREQLKEIELSRQHHAGDLQEKNRLSRMLDNKAIFQDRIVSRREAEYSRLKKEREDRINQLAAMRKREREIKRKLLFYIKSEEERLTKLQEEEEARKREEEERRKKEEAERKAKLDAIAERQRQRERELEEREKLRRDALLGKTAEPPSRPTDPVSGPRLSEPVAAAAAASSAGKYVLKFRRERAEGLQAASPEPDRWGRQDDRQPQSGDRWRSDDRRPSYGGGGSRLPSSSSWSSSRSRG